MRCTIPLGLVAVLALSAEAQGTWKLRKDRSRTVSPPRLARARCDAMSHIPRMVIAPQSRSAGATGVAGKDATGRSQ